MALIWNLIHKLIKKTPLCPQHLTRKPYRKNMTSSFFFWLFIKKCSKFYVSMYFISHNPKTKIVNKIVNKIKNREESSYCIFSNYVLFLSTNCNFEKLLTSVKILGLNPFEPSAAFHIKTIHSICNLISKSNDWFLYKMQYSAEICQ